MTKSADRRTKITEQ